MRKYYLWLAAILALVLLDQGIFTIDVVRDIGGHYPSNTIVLGDPWPAIVSINDRAKEAGLRRGDRVVSIDGRIPAGQMDLRVILHHKHPGDFLTVSIQRGGQVSEHRVSIAPLGLVGDGWFYACVMFFLVPWLSIALGFWVAVLRPGDKRAWLVLGILVGMSGLGRAGILDPFGWGLPGVVAAVFQEIVSPYGWNVCMMLFGFYFPQRWNLDEKLPWLKWLLLAPAAALAALHGTSRAFQALSYPSFAALRHAFPIPDWAQGVFMMVIVCFFFIGLSNKLRDASVPRDDRRRIGLLYFGCTIAMTPMFLLFIFDGVVNHRQPGDADGRWLTFSLMMMSLFPIVMAYVIVVERAMEVLRLETGGPPVGLFRPSRYQQAELALTTGDLLILYTDGISEAENLVEDEWGEDALISAVRTCASAPPAEMIATIMRLADAFASGAPQHDDMTLVVARVL